MQWRLTLQYVLASTLLLSLILFYLATNGKINNFPTYLLAVLVLVYGIMDRSILKVCARSRILQASAVMLFYLALSSFWSAQFDWLGVAKALGNVLLILGFMLAIMLIPRIRADLIDHLILALILSAVVSALYSLQLEYTVHFRPYHEDRLYALGRLGSPVFSALAYGFASIPAIQRGLITTDPLKKAGYSAITLLLWYTVYLTGSVAVWPGLLISALVISLLHYGLGIRIIGTTVITAVVVIVTATAMTHLYWPDLFESIFPRSTSFRPEIWRETIRMTVEHNGWLGFGHLDDGNFYIGDIKFLHAHSIFLASFYYGGILGILLLILLVAMTFTQLYHALRSGQELVTARLCTASLIFTCLVFSLDGDRVLEKVDLVWILFWLPLGLAAMIEVFPAVAAAQVTETNLTTK